MSMLKKLKHLEFIQNIISRMANNLFFLRGWTITLIAGLLTLFISELNRKYIFIVYFPVIIFWILDGYFLSQERAFRSLYDHVIKLNEEQIDFSMNTKPFIKDEWDSWFWAMLSPTLLIFYVPLILIILAIILLVT